MSSRQDQLHSYQFMIQRVVAALVLRDTDPAHSPTRRLAGAALASVLVAAIGLGAMVVYGALAGSGGTAGWRDGGAVIVEKESGARYVYRDGKLHLVVNYASALLIVGGDRATDGAGVPALVGRGGPGGAARHPGRARLDPGRRPALHPTRGRSARCRPRAPPDPWSRSALLVGTAPRPPAMPSVRVRCSAGTRTARCTCSGTTGGTCYAIRSSGLAALKLDQRTAGTGRAGPAQRPAGRGGPGPDRHRGGRVHRPARRRPGR